MLPQIVATSIELAGNLMSGSSRPPYREIEAIPENLFREPAVRTKAAK